MLEETCIVYGIQVSGSCECLAVVYCLGCHFTPVDSELVEGVFSPFY
jgi:hypothetical protein